MAILLGLRTLGSEIPLVNFENLQKLPKFLEIKNDEGGCWYGPH